MLPATAALWDLDAPSSPVFLKRVLAPAAGTGRDFRVEWRGVREAAPLEAGSGTAGCGFRPSHLSRGGCSQWAVDEGAKQLALQDLVAEMSSWGPKERRCLGKGGTLLYSGIPGRNMARESWVPGVGAAKVGKIIPELEATRTDVARSKV